MYSQLVSPKTTVTSIAGMCLWFTQEVFGVPHLFPSAYKAYLATARKHTDDLPNVSVPLWFDSYGSYGSPAVWDNWGHVATWFPTRGILTSPITFSQTGQQWYPSIDALVNDMNRILPNSKTKYLGWSEDLSGVQLIKKETEEMTTKDDLEKLWAGFFDRMPMDSEYQQFVGKPLETILDTAWSSAEFKNRMNGLRALYNEDQDLKKQVSTTGTFTAEDRTMLQSIYDFVKQILAKITGIFK